jgi:micrococcal nuclease
VTVPAGAWGRLVVLLVAVALGLAGCDLGPAGVGRLGGDGDVWTVVHVVDGDTVHVRRGDGTRERVRVIGIDTPERGECGFVASTAAVRDLVLGREVTLVAGARDDRDRYDRLLRYLDVDGVDVGHELLTAGFAVARYDSRDGHGRHPREDRYVATDAATPHVCDPDR